MFAQPLIAFSQLLFHTYYFFIIFPTSGLTLNILQHLGIVDQSLEKVKI